MHHELRYFIDILKMMSPQEVSSVVMIAAAARNVFIKSMSLDFGNPLAVIAQKPFITIHIGKLIKDCERKKHFADRTAYLVWLHTLRVAAEPELMPLGKEFWKELARGIEYLNHNPELVEKCTNEYADLTGYQLIPL